MFETFLSYSCLAVALHKSLIRVVRLFIDLQKAHLESQSYLHALALPSPESLFISLFCIFSVHLLGLFQLYILGYVFLTAPVVRDCGLSLCFITHFFFCLSLRTEHIIKFLWFHVWNLFKRDKPSRNTMLLSLCGLRDLGCK